jgi:hypothetical protein
MSSPHHGGDNPEKEVSRNEALETLLNDEDLADLTLQGKDGVLVHANRCMLAARSSVFRRMLFGEFSESDSSIVTVDYHSEVLKAIVQYIYTDDSKIFHKKCDADLARTVVSLIDAANFFNLGKLRRKAQKWAFTSMQQHPFIAGVFLDECSSLCSGGFGPEEEYALNTIRSFPSAMLQDGSALFSLNPATMEQLMQDEKIEADEYTLFLLLEAWSKATPPAGYTRRHEPPSSSTDDERDFSWQENRKDIAMSLVKHIRLDRIDPSSLSSTVFNSGLVSTEHLLDAYRTQALSAERQYGVTYKLQRYNSRPVWQRTCESLFTSSYDKHEVELLQVSSLTRGVHRWKIRIEAVCPKGVWLGLASTAIPLKANEWLGSQKGGWVYGSTGVICHDDSARNRQEDVDKGGNPPFGAGSEVCMTLDLSADCGGTLSASVDENPSVLLFSGLLSHLMQHEGAGGFVPAVSLKRPGCVRILEMSSV